MLEIARNNSTGGIFGGSSEDETNLHFAQRFDGSCARVELAVLDPKEQLKDVSDQFIRAFSGGQIRLLDIPCGCGAASAGILTTIAELRRLNILPRQPLEVFLTGGDVSDSARMYVELILNELGPSLRRQGMFVKSSLYEWDISDAASTTVLLDRWLTDGADCDKSFLLIANFSGFLGSETNLQKVEERLGEIFRWAQVRNSTAVWLEPPMKKSIREKIVKWFSGPFSRLMGWLRNQEIPSAQLDTEAKFLQPIRKTLVSVRLVLVSMENPSR